MARIPLNQGKFAIVDDEDFEYLNQWKWSFTPGRGYATRTDRSGNSQKTVSMHREILKPGVGQQVDHINRIRLDNRKENLRICTPGQNACNASKRKDGVTSKHKGVYFNERNGKYSAYIQIDRDRRFLGYYEKEDDAAYYYNSKVGELHGEFAVYNELPQNYTPSAPFAPLNARGSYSEYRGVTFDKRERKFIAQIQYDRGKRKRIGGYRTEREAALAYNEWAVKLHGEKAKLNEVADIPS